MIERNCGKELKFKMKDEKILMTIDEIGNLISDWRKVDSQEVSEEIEEMIIEKAAELTDLTKQLKSDEKCGCLCDECRCRNECEDCNFGRYFEMQVTANKLLQVMTKEQKKALATAIIAETKNPKFEEVQAVIEKLCQE